MPTLTCPHWRDVPANTWRWPNFSAAEIACRGTGASKINTEAMDKLQALRDRLGKPLIIRSAYRSQEHNRAVGGAPASKHMQATAFDIAMSNHDPAAFEAAAQAVGFLGFGCYPRSGFMHIDLGPARSWGDPFPARPVPFARNCRPRAKSCRKAAPCAGAVRRELRLSVRPGWKCCGTFLRKPSPRSSRWCPTSTRCAGC